MSTGLLIVGHGSRDTAANVEFESVVEACRSAYPTLVVAHGYVELAEPPLADAVRDLARRVDQLGRRVKLGHYSVKLLSHNYRFGGSVRSYVYSTSSTLSSKSC